MFTIMSIFAWNTRGEWRPWNAYTLYKTQFHELLRFGLPLVVGGVAAWGLYVMDRLFLRAFSTFSELGIYSVAVSIAAGAGILETFLRPYGLQRSSNGLPRGLMKRKLMKYRSMYWRAFSIYL